MGREPLGATNGKSCSGDAQETSRRRRLRLAAHTGISADALWAVGQEVLHEACRAKKSQCD
jgi:hypothetical protein